MSGEPKTLTPAELAGRLRLGAQAVAMTGDAPILWLRESRQTLVDLLNAAADKLEAVGVPVVARDEASELKSGFDKMVYRLGAAFREAHGLREALKRMLTQADGVLYCVLCKAANGDSHSKWCPVPGARAALAGGESERGSEP